MFNSIKSIPLSEANRIKVAGSIPVRDSESIWNAKDLNYITFYETVRFVLGFFAKRFLTIYLKAFCVFKEAQSFQFSESMRLSY